MRQESLNIVRATAAHASGIAVVHVRAWQSAYAGTLDPDFLAAISIVDRTKRWERNLTQDPATTAIAVLEGKVVGFASWGPCRDEAHEAGQGEIWAAYVDPLHWRKGIGRALLDHVLAGLQRDAYRSTSLWVLKKNDRAIAFYEASGFSRETDSSKLVEIGGRQVEELRYARTLSGEAG